MNSFDTKYNHPDKPYKYVAFRGTEEHTRAFGYLLGDYGIPYRFDRAADCTDVVIQSDDRVVKRMARAYAEGLRVAQCDT